MRALEFVLLVAVACLSVLGTSFGQPTIQIHAPEANSRYLGRTFNQEGSDVPAAELEVTATVVSAEPIASVIASVEDVEDELTRQNGDYFWGRLHIGDETSDGEKVITVTATTTTGQTGSATVTIAFDLAPLVFLEALRDGSVVRDSVRVRAWCEDNSPAGCTAMKLGTDTTWSAGASLDRVLDLSTGPGGYTAVSVHASDARGNVGVRGIGVWAERSRWLREVISSGGPPLLGFDGTHALHRSCNGARLLLRDRAGITTEVIARPLPEHGVDFSGALSWPAPLVRLPVWPRFAA